MSRGRVQRDHGGVGVSDEGPAEATKAERSVERVIPTPGHTPGSVTVLPEIPDQDRTLTELRRVLRSPEPAKGKPGGLLSITEEFPDPDYPFASETIRRVEAAGFSLERRFGNFWLYTVNFRKSAEVA